jgi:hypothetical protein
MKSGSHCGLTLAKVLQHSDGSSLSPNGAIGATQMRSAMIGGRRRRDKNGLPYSESTALPLHPSDSVAWSGLASSLVVKADVVPLKSMETRGAFQRHLSLDASRPGSS